MNIYVDLCFPWQNLVIIFLIKFQTSLSSFYIPTCLIKPSLRSLTHLQHKTFQMNQTFHMYIVFNLTPEPQFN